MATRHSSPIFDRISEVEDCLSMTQDAMACLHAILEDIEGRIITSSRGIDYAARRAHAEFHALTAAIDKLAKTARVEESPGGMLSSPGTEVIRS